MAGERVLIKLKMETETIENLYYTAMAEPDPEILSKFVTPHYAPCDNPVAMAVGTISPSEKGTIKMYHQKQFGIPIVKTRVASTNIGPETPGVVSTSRWRYDHSSFGLLGDARMDYCYITALSDINGFHRKFDMIYIRNPDLIGEDWDYVFARAMEYVEKDGGVAVTLIRKYDTKKYGGLLDRLKSKFNMEPVFSSKTGISLDEGKYAEVYNEDFHHTIGIFKPTR